MIQLIPAIDILNGQCVRLRRGDFATAIYYQDSVLEAAQSLAADGFTRLHLVDLDGAHHQPLHNVPASLVYAARASDVRTVIVAGRVIMRDRRLLTLGKAEIIRQVIRSLERLSRRTPTSRIQVYRP